MSKATTGRAVAFCVVTWNNEDVIAECLDSIVAQTGVDVRLYVLDNASTDGTRDVVTRYPSVRLARARQNYGFAKGNNILIRKALEDPDVGYIALINSDAVLDPGWARVLVDFAGVRPRTGCLQGLTLDYYNHEIVDSKHIFVNANLQGIQVGHGDPNRPGDFYARKVFGVNAAAALYTRAMIEALPDRKHGFFDERFYMYYEDIDVCFRSLISGWDAWFVPDALAYHMGSVSSKKRGSIFSMRMVARNQSAVIVKNAPAAVIVKTLIPAIKAERHFLGQIRRDEGSRAAYQVLGSFLVGLVRAPRYLGSRLRIQGARRIDSDYLLRIMNQDGVLG
jgi:GT2 family glycosyltransferase